MSTNLERTRTEEPKHKARSWREAATLVIAAKDESLLLSSHETDSFDYRLLLLQRQSKSRSFAGSSVFPGGVADTADFSIKWVELFRKLGIQNPEDFGWGHMKGKPRAGLIAAQREGGLLPNDVAFRICAIRETFEESGILLAGKRSEVLHSISLMGCKQFAPSTCSSDSFHSEESIQTWRRKVHEDASEFMVMCLELDVYPNLWSLFELSTILTPPFVSRRFDTIFYICSLDKLPKAEIDYKEMTGMMWLTPAEGLRLHFRHEIELPFPQLTECARLLDFPRLSTVEEYAASQMDQGMSVEVPIPVRLKDVVIRVMPGDDCYPAILPSADQKALQLNETEEENLRRCQNLNRCTFMYGGRFKLVCNVTLPYGKHPPRNIDSNDWIDMSKH